MKLLLDFFLISGILVTLVITFILFKSSDRNRPKNILMLIFTSFFLVLLCFYGYFHRVKLLFYLGFLIEDSINVLTGPLLLLYVKSIFDSRKGLIKKNIIHFIPVLFYIIAISIPAFVAFIFENISFSYLEIIDDYIALDIIYSLIYILVSLKILVDSENRLKDNYSYLDDKDLKWVRKFLLGLVAVILIDVSTTVYELFYGRLDWQTGYITIVGLVILIFYLGYHGISQSQILLPDFILDGIENKSLTAEYENQTGIESKLAETDNFKKTPKKESNHHLANSDHGEIEKLKLRLNFLLNTEKVYLNENLTLGGLAELIPTTEKKLSALLNHYLGTNFYDLINSHRVEEFKTKIHKGEHQTLTLLALAYESGFKSKASFNRVFKQVTGQSPSAYKKSLGN